MLLVRQYDLTWYTNTSILCGVDKPLIWLGASRAALKEFPDDARQIAGFQLRRVQKGLEPNDWKPMTAVGGGVKEIRIHTGLEHRVLYLATFAEESMFCTPSRSAHRRLPNGMLNWLASVFAR